MFLFCHTLVRYAKFCLQLFMQKREMVFYVCMRFTSTHHAIAGIMFILGIFMGVGSAILIDDADDHLSQSLLQWSNINYEVLLLIFLPGLVFNDSFGLDVHLFGLAFWQCALYA